jgi:hypothetical protein
VIPGVTVVITAIPERPDFLARAVMSVLAQTCPPTAIVIALDVDYEGAAITRTRALRTVQTEWTAFLDDDDEFKPVHLQHLMAYAREKGSDMVFPWFDVRGGTDPFPSNEHREFDLNDPHQTTVTILVKTEAALEVNGYLWEDGLDPKGEDHEDDAQGHRAGEEFRFAMKLATAGYKIDHLDEHTWIWHHHGQNTMGMPSRRRR